MDCLADALGDAAMDLSFKCHRIDHRPEIVNHRIAQQIDLAGAGIDFQLDDMAAIGIGGAVGLVLVLDVERMRAIVGHQPKGKVLDGDGMVGVCRGEHTVGEDHLLFRTFQRFRGMRAGGVDRFRRHLGDGRAQNGCHARAAGRARRSDGAVALQDLDLVGVKPQPVGQNLCQRRAMALPVFLLRGQHKDGAVLAEADIDTTIGAATTLLQIHAKAEAAKTSLALGFSASCRETCHIGARQRRFHQFRHLAAIYGAATDHGKGDLVSTDQVAPTHLDPVNPDMLGNMIHQPFHDVIGLRPTSAAIGIDRRCVRHDAKHTETRDRDGIIRGERARPGQGRNIGAVIREPRSHVGVNRDSQGMHLAGLVDHGARLCTVVAAMKVRHETV